MTDDRIEQMFELQNQLQTTTYGQEPSLLRGEERIQFFKDMKLALEAELQEAIDEMGWKPWASSKHWNEDAVKGELVDAWHFFMNLCLVAGMEPQELFEKYTAKRLKNIKRQVEGYDGIAGKCPQCRRALDDDAVGCYVTDSKSACQVTGDIIPLLPTRPLDYSGLEPKL